jgi:hypothetical protein
MASHLSKTPATIAIPATEHTFGAGSGDAAWVMAR